MANNRRMRFAGIVTVALFLGLVLRFWHPVYGFTDFLRLDAANDKAAIAAFHDLPVYVYHDVGTYDGHFYAQIAYHPLLNSPELWPAIDNVAYRARRILPAAAAWIIAGGNRGWIVQVYSLINVAAWLALAAVLWRLLAVSDARSWVAWLGVLFSAGALASVRLALTDLPALAAIAGSMLALERNRKGWSTGWMAAACLSRETSVLALPGIWRRGQVASRDRRVTTGNLTPLLAVVPLVAWLAYIRWRIGPGDQGWGNFTWPLIGFLEKWRATFASIRSLPDVVLAGTTLLALIGLTAQLIYLAAHARVADSWWRIGAAYGVLMLFLGTAVWDGYPGAATRVLLPMTLAFNVLACRRRATLEWLIVGNLTVMSGLLAMNDLPSDPREIAAGHAGGSAYVVHVGKGWYDIEHTARHVRTWSSGTGRLEIETWPRRSRALQLEFSTRSVTPHTVVIRQNGTELWRGQVGKEYLQISVPFEVADGRTVLDFSTNAPGVPEGPGPDARSLAFNLRDPKVVRQ